MKSRICAGNDVVRLPKAIQQRIHWEETLWQTCAWPAWKIDGRCPPNKLWFPLAASAHGCSDSLCAAGACSELTSSLPSLNVQPSVEHEKIPNKDVGHQSISKRAGLSVRQHPLWEERSSFYERSIRGQVPAQSKSHSRKHMLTLSGWCSCQVCVCSHCWHFTGTLLSWKFNSLNNILKYSIYPLRAT